MINLGFTHGSKISILYPDANFPVIKNCHLKLKMKKKKETAFKKEATEDAKHVLLLFGLWIRCIDCLVYLKTSCL